MKKIFKLMFFGLASIPLLQCGKKSDEAAGFDNTEDAVGEIGVTAIYVHNTESGEISELGDTPFIKVTDEAKRLFYTQAHDFLIADRLISARSSAQDSLSRASRIIPRKYQDPELNGILFDIAKKIWSNDEEIHRMLVNDGWIFFEKIPLFRDFQGAWNIQVSSNEFPIARRAAVFSDADEVGQKNSLGNIYLKLGGHEFDRFWDGSIDDGQAVVYIMNVDEREAGSDVGP